MPVPILKQGDYLIATVQTALTDADLLKLREDLAVKVGRTRALGVIVDVSAVDLLDSFATRMLRAIAQIVKLRGADTVIVGIQPDVAFSMVQLGLGGRMAGVATALDLEDGVALLDRTLTERRADHAR